MRYLSKICPLLLLLLLTLCSCSVKATEEDSILTAVEETSTEEDEVIHILLTHTELNNSVTDLTATYLADRLSYYSDGTMEISVYADNSLGSISTASESLSKGTTQMRIGTTASSSISIFRWLPTLCDMEPTDMVKALEEGHPIRDLMDKECLDNGYRILGNLPISYRVITSNTPLDTLDDFKGLKMRTIFNGMENDYWSLLGAETTAFDIDKVYLALQRGYVNAQDNTIPSIISNRFWEQQQYVTLTRHRVYGDQIFINEAFYQSLTSQQQEWLAKAVEAAISYGSLQMSYYTDTGLYQLKERGLSVIRFPQEEREKMMDILRPYTYEALTQSHGQKLVDQIIEAAGKDMN